MSQIVRVLVFLTPRAANPAEAEIAVLPSDALVNTGPNPEDKDSVEWVYVTELPPGVESPVLPIPQPPQPDQVYLEIRFPPGNTPFPPPLGPQNNAASGPVEGDGASYGKAGAEPIAANEPATGSENAPPGENQETEPDPDPEFEVRIRRYKYGIVLTTQTQIFTLDPRLFLRGRHRRQ
jgi:hypothetical protein